MKVLMHTQKRLGIKDDQRGFAAMVVAVVLVVILSLITIGFVTLARNNTRDTLDRQLSTEAYYAAETGINDAAGALNAGEYVTTAKSDCTANTGALSHYIIDSALGVEYSCLLIDPAPLTLEYGSIDPSESVVTTLTGVTKKSRVDRTISTLEFSWQDDKARAHFRPSSAIDFTPSSSWRSGAELVTGVLQVSVTPLPTEGNGNINRDSLVKDTFTVFLYPNADGSRGRYGTVGYTSNEANQGQIVNGHCNQGNNSASNTPPRYCNVKITGLTKATYLIRVKSFYDASQLTVTAFDSGNEQLRLKGAQSLVDSTGKAQDVLRRIQVRIPSKNSYNYPEFAIESTGSICKRLQIMPGDLVRNDCSY